MTVRGIVKRDWQVWPPRKGAMPLPIFVKEAAKRPLWEFTLYRRERRIESGPGLDQLPYPYFPTCTRRDRKMLAAIDRILHQSAGRLRRMTKQVRHATKDIPLIVIVRHNTTLSDAVD